MKACALVRPRTIQCYEKVLTIVDGNRPPDVVFDDIRKAVAISQGEEASAEEE